MGNLLCPLVLLLLISALNSNSVLATTAGIISFTQSTGAVTPQGSITFHCEATGDEAEWRINGVPRFSSYGEFTLGTQYTNLRWTLTLTVQATIHNNGTRVSCFASNSRIIGQYVIQTKTFIIAAPPLPPAPVVVNSNATFLSVIWEEPHSTASFPITGYKLDVVNKTSGVRTVLVGFSSVLSYNMSIDEVVSACHQLNFSVTAYNELGDATGHVIGMFPKVPEPVEITPFLSFAADGTPRLHITSLHREACSYHGAEYIIRIITSDGGVIREARGDQLNERNEFEEELNSGLIMGQTYTISVVGSSPAGSSTLETEITIEFETNQVLCDPQLPDPQNGQVTVTNTPVGSVAVYTCSNRYIRNGNLTRTCLHDGSWSGSAPTCDPLCDPALPNPMNGRVTVNSTSVGSVAVYTCLDQFILSGNSTRTCLMDGTWSSPSPACNPEFCDSIPPNPLNGQVTVLNNSVGSVILYTCSEGYLLNGDSERTCLVNGTWSGTAPTCLAIYCDPNLPDPLNGQVTLSNNSVESVAVYICSEGYLLDGDPTRTCLHNGTWSGTLPTCIAIHCDHNLPDPSNGQVTVMNTSVGSVAIYTCSDGYLLNSNPNRTCQLNGTWSSPVPTCKPDLESNVVSNTAMITGLSIGMAIVVSLLVAVVVTIIICFVCRRHRRKRMSNSIDGRQFTTDSVNLSARQPPNSIKINKCATNPIYEGGPIYDTPMGETFKSLLTSTPSTPSTPADSPRYFHMPPQLPPPRKASVSAPVHSEVTSPFPQPTVDEVEKIQESFNAAVPHPEDEYTIMNPIRTGRPSRFKPSPLVIPNSTMENNGVYITVN